MVDHLQPKPIMVLHLDDTIKMGHEHTHKKYAFTKGTPIQVGLEDRTDTLQPKPAKTTIVVECPPETGIRTRDAFMKRINGHQSDVASTIASKDPHNTFRGKSASEHTAGQSGSHAWRLHLPMQLLPRLTQALQTIEQEEENAGNPGPYWLTETDYESLYIPRQQYTEHKEDRITSVQEILDDLDREQLELGRSIASFLKGFRPVGSYRLLVQFHQDADRRLIAQLLEGMKSYELVHVMTNVILNRSNWTQSTSRSRDIKRPPKPTRHDTTTVFVGWTQGAGDDTAKVVASFFGCWTSWKPEPNMWRDAGCTYASLQYQHATAVALSAGQYIGVAPGEYVHITLGDDNTDTQAAERIDQMLAHKMPQETGDEAAFGRRMKAGKQLGSDMMTERVIKEINREKQLFAEPEPINVADWDEAIVNELSHTTNDDTPSDTHSNMATIDTDETSVQQPDNPAKLTTTHARQSHPAQKTKAHNKTPQKTPTKTTPPPKEKKSAPASPQSTQQADSTAAFTVDNRHKGKEKGAAKKPAGQREKVRCLFLMPCIAIMALLLLLAPTHTEGPVYLLPVNWRVRRRYTPPLRHRHGYVRGPNPHSYRIWQPGLLLLYIACFFHTPTAPITAAPCRYHAPLTITTVTSPYNTRYNTNLVLQCGDVHPNPGDRRIYQLRQGCRDVRGPPIPLLDIEEYAQHLVVNTNRRYDSLDDATTAKDHDMKLASWNIQGAQGSVSLQRWANTLHLISQCRIDLCVHPGVSPRFP